MAAAAAEPNHRRGAGMWPAAALEIRCHYPPVYDPAMTDAAAVPTAVAALARTQAGLRVLMLIGSRARGDAHARSDWDFGYLAAPDFNPADLLAGLVEALACDRVDLVDLDRANGLLRFRAACDGVVIHEAEPDAGNHFRVEAARFWHDVEPVLLPAYEHFLEQVGRESA